MLALPRSPFPKSPRSLGAVGREVEEGCCGTHGRCVRGESPSPVPTYSTDPSPRSSPASCPKNLPERPLPRDQARPQHQDQLLLQKALSLWKKGLFFPLLFPLCSSRARAFCIYCQWLGASARLLPPASAWQGLGADTRSSPWDTGRSPSPPSCQQHQAEGEGAQAAPTSIRGLPAWLLSSLKEQRSLKSCAQGHFLTLSESPAQHGGTSALMRPVPCSDCPGCPSLPYRMGSAGLGTKHFQFLGFQWYRRAARSREGHRTQHPKPPRPSPGCHKHHGSPMGTSQELEPHCSEPEDGKGGQQRRPEPRGKHRGVFSRQMHEVFWWHQGPWRSAGTREVGGRAR